jgi:hypothetical protein
MKQSTFNRGTKYGFKEIHVGEQRVLTGLPTRKVKQAAKNYNYIVHPSDRFGVQVLSDGDKTIIKRIW